MTGLELLTIICALLALIASGGFAIAASRVLRAARDLEVATRAFNASAVPAVDDIRVAAERASRTVERVDEVLSVAGAIGGRVDSASDVAYRAVASPLIKGAAFASGTKQAARRLRGDKGDQSDRSDRTTGRIG